MGMGFFGIMDFLFPVMFLLVFGMFLAGVLNGISQWRKNNRSPRLTVPATLVSRRYSVSHHRSGVNNGMHHTSTSHYVTFQFESGDRMEFHVSGQEYGLMAEGDRGMLTFQGTRFLEFQRT